MRRTRRVVRKRQQELVGDVRRVRAALDASEFENAREVGLALLAACKAEGIESALVYYLLAVAADMTQRPAEAFGYLDLALDMEPVCPEYQGSYRVVVNHARELLAAAEPGMVPSLYRLLLERGEADAACHVTQAKFLYRSGSRTEAARLLEAVTCLDPTHRGAFELLAAVQRSLGNETAAVLAQAHAAALEDSAVPQLHLKMAEA